jgi:hypothetical protein
LSEKKVTAIAKRVLKRLGNCDGAVWAGGKPDGKVIYFCDLLHVCTVADIKALASALTQAPDLDMPFPSMPMVGKKRKAVK